MYTSVWKSTWITPKLLTLTLYLVLWCQPFILPKLHWAHGLNPWSSRRQQPNPTPVNNPPEPPPDQGGQQEQQPDNGEEGIEEIHGEPPPPTPSGLHHQVMMVMVVVIAVDLLATEISEVPCWDMVDKGTHSPNHLAWQINTIWNNFWQFLLTLLNHCRLPPIICTNFTYCTIIFISSYPFTSYTSFLSTCGFWLFSLLYRSESCRW